MCMDMCTSSMLYTRASCCDRRYVYTHVQTHVYTHGHAHRRTCAHTCLRNLLVPMPSPNSQLDVSLSVDAAHASFLVRPNRPVNINTHVCTNVYAHVYAHAYANHSRSGVIRRTFSAPASMAPPAKMPATAAKSDAPHNAVGSGYDESIDRCRNICDVPTTSEQRLPRPAAARVEIPSFTPNVNVENG